MNREQAEELMAFAKQRGEELRGDRPKPNTPDITELAIQELMSAPAVEAR